MSHPFTTAIRLGIVLVLLLLSVGCGQRAKPRVEGKVTYRGAPLAGQRLALTSEGGPGEFVTIRFDIAADGSFSGELPVPGKYKVSIEKSLAVQEGKAKGTMDVPERYRTPGTSDLTWDIEPDENRRDFELGEAR